MDKAEINATVVYHAWAKEHDPRIGNKKLMEEISGRPRLLPTWVLLPPATRELKPPEEILQEMVAKKVVMGRLFPKDHRFPLVEWCCGELLSTMEAHRMPILVDLDQTDPEHINAVCQSHPELPIVLSNVNYRVNRFLFPLLSRNRNLHLETSFYQNHRGIETLCKRFGSSRLLFGSRSPEFAPGPMAMAIRYAQISGEEKSKILGGNLNRLIEGIRD